MKNQLMKMTDTKKQKPQNIGKEQRMFCGFLYQLKRKNVTTEHMKIEKNVNNRKIFYRKMLHHILKIMRKMLQSFVTGGRQYAEKRNNRSSVCVEK